MAPDPFTMSDVERLAAHLDPVCAGLDQRERDLLHAVFAWAGQAVGGGAVEVEGFGAALPPRRSAAWPTPSSTPRSTWSSTAGASVCRIRSAARAARKLSGGEGREVRHLRDQALSPGDRGEPAGSLMDRDPRSRPPVGRAGGRAAATTPAKATMPHIT